MSVSDVLAEYSRIKQNNELEAIRRRQEVYAHVPQLEALHQKIHMLMLERLRQAITNEQDGRAEITKLREQSARLLIDAGFDVHYLDPIYSCPHCRDTGLLDDTTHCECFKKRLLEDKLDSARLTDSEASFERFDFSLFEDTPIENGKSQRDMVSRIRDLCITYADSFPNCSPILLLSGGIGLGKTYVSKCIMRRVIERGHTAASFTAYRLFSLFHQHRLGEDVDLDPILEVPLLIIDDIGTEPMTKNVTKEYFFDLINERSSTGRKTVIVTNLPFHELDERYGERIFSRLMDSRFSQKILFKGRDIRY